MDSNTSNSRGKMVIKTPDNWGQVSIAQFQEMSATTNPVEVAAILCDEDTEVLKKLDVSSMAKIEAALEWTSILPNEANFKNIIEVEGEKYGFVNRLTDLTVGEWVDLEFYTQDTVKNMHKIMAILYRPLITAFTDTQRIVEPYDSATGQIRAELFLDNVSVGDVYGALVFFSLIVKESTVTMQDYLESLNPKGWKELMRLNRKERFALLMRRHRKSGHGSDIFTRSQKEILRKWNLSLN